MPRHLRRASMLLRMVRKSICHRPALSAWTLTTLGTCAFLATVFITLDLEIEAKLRHTVRQSGANAVAREAADGSAAAWHEAERLTRSRGVQSALLRLEAVQIGGSPVGLVTARAQDLRRLTPYWRVQGRWPEAEGECLAGRSAAEALHLPLGSVAHIHRDTGERSARVVGVFESGDEDERRVFVPAGPRPGGEEQTGAIPYMLLSVPGGIEGILDLANDLHAVGIELTPLRQFVHGENAVLTKVGLLMGLTLGVVLLLAALGVSASVLARVVERRVELGLLQALGAHRRNIVGLLITESALYGIGAGLLGFGLGTVSAHRISLALFGLGVSARALALMAALVLPTIVSVVAGGLSALRGLKLRPAEVLRGNG